MTAAVAPATTGTIHEVRVRRRVARWTLPLYFRRQNLVDGYADRAWAVVRAAGRRVIPPDPYQRLAHFAIEPIRLVPAREADVAVRPGGGRLALFAGAATAQQRHFVL